MAVAGVDIDKLLDGAREAERQYRTGGALPYLQAKSPIACLHTPQAIGLFLYTYLPFTSWPSGTAIPCHSYAPSHW